MENVQTPPQLRWVLVLSFCLKLSVASLRTGLNQLYPLGAVLVGGYFIYKVHCVSMYVKKVCLALVS